MSFAFIVFHYPKPQYRDDMLRSMRAVAEIMSSVPGFVDAGQWAEEDSDRIAGISLWESKEACERALEKASTASGKFAYDDEREARPREEILREAIDGGDGSRGISARDGGRSPLEYREPGRQSARQTKAEAVAY